ncbi:set domain-containing protein 5 [Stagonosporopsis vannaccii]|nr:set domain-containing protein 5 [Stagonosporopsis vannaccii]
MADPDNISASSSDTIPIAPPNPYYEIRAVPGKGYGCIATTPIPRGTRILADSALLSVPNAHYMASDIALAFAALTAAQQSLYLSLHSAHGQAPSHWPSSMHASVPARDKQRILEQHAARTAPSPSLLSIFQTNCMELGHGAGVFPHAARFNHSCVPNATFAWNERLRKETVHAMRDVGVGEELVICYVDVAHDRRLRAWELRHYGFVCGCVACGEGEDDSSPAFASAQRRLQLYDLDRETRRLRGSRLDDGAAQPGFAAKLLKMAALLQEEGAWDARLAGVFLDIALVCEANGDFMMGVRAGERALQVKRDAQGVDAADYKKYGEVLERIRAGRRREVGAAEGWRA